MEGRMFSARPVIGRFSTALALVLLVAGAVSRPLAAGPDEGSLEESLGAISRQLQSLSYELTYNYINAEGKSAAFVFRFWNKGRKWRAERSEINNGKEIPSYVQSFDGEHYQILHYAEDKIKISAKIFPKGLIFPSALYDNAPFQATGFLSFDDATVLPSNLRALAPSEALDPEKWKAFFERAKSLGVSERFEGAKYSLANVAPDEEHATQVEVEFSNQSALFPSRVSKIRSQRGLKSMEVEILKFQATGIPGFSFPSEMQFKWYSPQAGNSLLYTGEVKLTSLAVNEPMADEKFSIDLSLASQVWDVDNRITLPTRATP